MYQHFTRKQLDEKRGSGRTSNELRMGHGLWPALVEK